MEKICPLANRVRCKFINCSFITTLDIYTPVILRTLDANEQNSRIYHSIYTNRYTYRHMQTYTQSYMYECNILHISTPINAMIYTLSNGTDSYENESEQNSMTL